jgi:hypothetical protein
MQKLGLEFAGEFESEGFGLVRYATERSRYDATAILINRA